MPQKRHRPTLTLTCDADIIKAAKAIVRRVPGLTLSALVDQQLRLFVANMQPLMDQLEATTDHDQRVRIMQAMFGQHVVSLSEAFTKGIASTHQEAPEGG